MGNKTALLVFLSLLIITACSRIDYTGNEFQAPTHSADGLETASLSDAGMDEKQIIPAEWLDKTKTAYVATPWIDSGEQYGFQCWLKSYPYGTGEITALHRTGWGGQDIAVFDELDMVVVFTGGNYMDGSTNNEIISQHILPATIDSIS